MVSEAPATEPPPARAAGGSGRLRWAVVVAAVAAGALLGVVVAGARHDAAEVNEVGVILGGIAGLSAPGEPAAADVQLLNVGEREIEILGFGADGLSIAPGSPAPEPVTAPPGEWVTIQQEGLVPDCTAEPPERLDVRIAVFNDGADEITVHELGADSPGLLAEPAGPPVVVPPGQAAGTTLTWTVDDCAMAGQFFDVNLTSSLAEGADRRGDPLGHQLVTGPARAELVRLVDRACESEG